MGHAQTPYRPFAARSLDPPLPSGLPDALDLLARQVRVGDREDAPVHRLDGEPYGMPWGRQYQTVCDTTLTAHEGAMLTTREATCEGCLAGGR